MDKLKIALAALAFALPVQSFAETAKEKKPELEKVSKSDEKLNPWTDCGIGAMLFDETKWAAVTSNIIWDWGITATTSAVSSKHTCEGKKVVAAFFINQTYANIEEETANGNGAHITAMLNILGCNSASQQNIIDSVRADFSKAAASASYAEKTKSAKAQDYYFILDEKVSGRYAQQCQAI
ncbi:MAG: hypothetical protein JWM78_798 [Verrucomicrobiaceae bacterium]|nr:hypothetical protein [Verrucomicrobiaceae bacterium]